MKPHCSEGTSVKREKPKRVASARRKKRGKPRRRRKKRRRRIRKRVNFSSLKIQWILTTPPLSSFSLPDKGRREQGFPPRYREETGMPSSPSPKEGRRLHISQGSEGRGLSEKEQRGSLSRSRHCAKEKEEGKKFQDLQEWIEKPASFSEKEGEGSNLPPGDASGR
jgi:hypothetical protein